MDLQTDEDEHSIEMHLPYVRKVFEGFANSTIYTILFLHPLTVLHLKIRVDIKIVPILVGAIDKEKEVAFGRTLAAYLARDDTFCVISSDFCHWYVSSMFSLCIDIDLIPSIQIRGTRFSYTFYYPERPPTSLDPIRLSRTSSPPNLHKFPIYESISSLDHEAMELLTLPPCTAQQAHTYFAEYLARTKNTICGRHPIGVLLGALSALEKGEVEGVNKRMAKLQWVRYEQSSQCLTIKDSSVSYASAFVVF